MRIPLVKEWGSWAVFSTSCLAGLIAGLKTQPWLSGREYGLMAALTFLGMAFLINSKNPLASAIRSHGKREHVLWACFFAVAGLAMLMPFLLEGFGTFVIFSVLIASYVVLLSAGREHHIITELNGFALLTISAPAIYFAVTGEMSWKLYIAVTLFFSAGVFKVRMRLRKNSFFRWAMVLYCATAAGVCLLVNISVILLLPLVENIVSAVRPGEEKLSTTGYTELAKSIVFAVLVWSFWE